MKPFRFPAAFLIPVSTIFFLLSCVSGSNKNINEVTADTTPVKTPRAGHETGLGNELIIQHKVANFAKWKKAYESHDSVRRSYGLTNYILGRGSNDSNMVIVILKMEDVDKAKTLTASQDLKDRMREAGIIGKPSFIYFERITIDTSKIGQKERILATYKVKDWDAWKKRFDGNKGTRMEAGFIERGVGHNVGDNHFVTIVFAISDMQKATAFLKRPDLKGEMAKDGMEGDANFFFYSIVQKY